MNILGDNNSATCCLLNGQKNPSLNGYVGCNNISIINNEFYNCFVVFLLGFAIKGSTTYIAPTNTILQNNYTENCTNVFSSKGSIKTAPVSFVTLPFSQVSYGCTL